MNLPNRLTLLRIFMIPLVVFFYLATFIPYGKLVAFVVFVLAACTDFLDGMIARRRNMVTDLGKFLDPIADKVLTMTGLILIVAWPVADGLPIVSSTPNYAGIIGIVGAIIILAREFIISAFRMIAARKNLVIKADKAGKMKTIVQDIVIPGYILYAFLVSEFTLSKTFHGIAGIFLLTLFCISVLLTITSGVNYIVKNKNVLVTEKKMEKGEPAKTMPQKVSTKSKNKE